MTGHDPTPIAGTLTGIRVLEIGSNIAGPMAAMILGDLGADVMKVEDPRHGDDTRGLAPLIDGESTVFRSFNRSKRSVALDLGTNRGRAAALRLAAGVDVVIQNLRPGVVDRLGVGFEAVSRVNESVIYCSISAFGPGDIGRSLPGYDALVQAFSGIMASTGHPGDAGPVRVSASLVDVSTGVWAALGVLAALLRRPQAAGPQLVEPSLLDTAFTLMAHQVNAYLVSGEVPERLGSGSPSFAPYQAYRASDGSIFVAAGSDRLFAKLCTVLSVPELAADDRFATAAARVANRQVLDHELERHLLLRPVGAWIATLTDAGIPACPVNDLGRAIDAPITAERKLLVGEDRSKVPWLRLPIDRERADPYRPTPALGQHTREVLREAGLAEADVDALAPS